MNVTDQPMGFAGSLVIGFGKNSRGEELVPTEGDIYSRFFRVEAQELTPKDDSMALLSIKFWGLHTEDNLNETYWQTRELLVKAGVSIGQSYAYNENNDADGTCATLDMEISYNEGQSSLEKIRAHLETAFVDLRRTSLNKMACEEYRLV